MNISVFLFHTFTFILHIHVSSFHYFADFANKHGKLISAKSPSHIRRQQHYAQFKSYLLPTSLKPQQQQLFQQRCCQVELWNIFSTFSERNLTGHVSHATPKRTPNTAQTH